MVLKSGGGGKGPIAQLAEPPAHNRSVPGSNPGGPTNYCVMKIGDKPEREFSRPVERKIWLLGGEQGSVLQSEAEIPRDLGKKGAPHRLHPFFCAEGGPLFQISDFGFWISDFK